MSPDKGTAAAAPRPGDGKGDTVRVRRRYTLSSYGRPPSPWRRVLPWLFALIGWAAAVALALGYDALLGIDLPLPGREVRLADGGDGPGAAPAADDELPSEPSERVVNLIDPAYPLARAGDPGWDYHRMLTTDLNGDGRLEIVHLIARVDRYAPGPNGFAWDDGHVWQVYVEDGDGEVTYLFSRWVQLGELRVASIDPFVEPESRGLAIVALEGARVALYRVDYRGTGDFDVVEVAGVPILAEAIQVP